MTSVKAIMCDDEIRILPFMASELRKEFARLGVELEVDTAATVTEMMEKLAADETAYQIFFMDIDIPDENGIHAAAAIRSMLPDAVIVFISAQEKQVFDTFAVMPAGFIRKGSFREDLRSTAERLVSLYFKSRPQPKAVTDALGHTHSLDLSQIIYIEVKDKYLDIVSDSETEVIRLSLSSFLEQVGENPFLQVHKSYAVKTSAIFRLEKNRIILDNGQEIPVSRYRMGEVKKAFLDAASTGYGT